MRLRVPFVSRQRYEDLERREALARSQLRDLDRKYAAKCVELVEAKEALELLTVGNLDFTAAIG